MKPVFQTAFAPTEGDPDSTGNCMAACVASVLDLPLAHVPNFAALDNWWTAFEEWLAKRGYFPVVVDGCDTYPGIHLASGKSPRGDYAHLVVRQGAATVHDPHPSGAGLDGEPRQLWFLVPMDPRQEPTQ